MQEFVHMSSFIMQPLYRDWCNYDREVKKDLYFKNTDVITGLF